ncbi:uncharacterized protein KGF55_005751 [Candida pseudojiufengensis]|uniref:uncharacterized protein n=1 Tax=Candida pseudojiufengensis TaxID=497109 RepID=UPI0022250ECE|nr:uncharacterized protein KGF55_005751 [Candida pseudojiufengensis]KAI5958491.1 hypothetical protein KGF55_005751 [Candida pseudojiufengensis]
MNNQFNNSSTNTSISPNHHQQQCQQQQSQPQSQQLNSKSNSNPSLLQNLQKENSNINPNLNQNRIRSGTLPSSFFSNDQSNSNNFINSINYNYNRNNSININHHNHNNNHNHNHSGSINLPSSSSSSSSPIHFIDSLSNINNNNNNVNNNDNLLNIPNNEINISSSSPINHNFIDNNSFHQLNNNNTTTLSSSPNKRVRSGSLFSNHSIWNDDNHSLSNSYHSHNSDSNGNGNTNTNTNTNNGNQFSSPSLDSTSFPIQTSSRNRSYTTNSTIPNLTINSSSNDPFNCNNNNNISIKNLNNQKVSNSPFNSVSNKTNDMNLLLDNFMLTNNNNNNNYDNYSGNGVAQLQPQQSQQQRAPRIRSQTYSGTTPPTVHEQLFNNNIPSSTIKQFHQPQNSVQQQFLPVFESTNDELNNNNQVNLIDDFDFGTLIITTNFENTNLGPTKYLLIDNLPLFIDSKKLFSILNNNNLNNNNQNKFGNVKSIKISITTTSKLALIECLNIEIAMNLKANFNHLEIIPNIILYVAFAKIEPANKNQINQQEQQSQSQQHHSSQFPHQESNKTVKPPSQSDEINEFETTTNKTNLSSIQISLMESIKKLSTTIKVDLNKIQSIINKCLTYPNDQYQEDFGPLPEPISIRQFDSPTLRDLRKILENKELGITIDNQQINNNNNELLNINLEELSLAMLDELPEICYDYLGNTIIQKLFTLIENPLIKLIMVKEITPFLTQLSIHKNGTWAIQKIINLSIFNYQQMYLIGASLKPYSVKLFNDQFGNYVLQNCIKFGSPYNDFIFEVIIDNFLDISFGRFGSRCIRTILETYYDFLNPTKSLITNEQILIIVGLIIEFSNELILNNNGSLLITWYLDSFIDFENKIELLINKILPNIRHLCVHKLSNLTILKLLNLRIDQNLKQQLIDSIFGNIENLEFILQESDNNLTNSGPLFIYKILSYPNLSDLVSSYLPIIKRLLMELNIINYHNYKKLMDEVGLTSSRINRNLSVKRNNNRRNNNNHNHNNHNSHQNGNRNGNHYNNTNHSNNQDHNNSNQNFNQNQQPIPYIPNYSNQIQQQPYIPLQQSQNFINQPSMYMKQYYAQQAMPQPNIPLQQQQYQYNSPAINPQQPQQPPPPPQQQSMSPQDLAVMQQLEQLSLSSAALGYNSNPSTPSIQRNSYL